MEENKENINAVALSNYNGDYQTDIKNPLELKPHPENPREEIEETDPGIQALAQDVKERGIIEPLVVTPDDFILCGHRRLKAAIVAGLEFVPVVVRKLRPEEFAEDFFLSENGHRQNLSVLEEAKAIAALQDKLQAGGRKCGSNELARRLNMTPIVVTERLAILEMPERVRLLYHK
ncbi:MAG TPA: ParB/RepB/Spo0J family partition protein, partial [Pyrinomonadaceae bacterium]|nr:ParB/RepB/Spo0J family partition protein [Pyrinomonadaceae bacterium]